MTVITKASDLIRKGETIINAPLVVDVERERPRWRSRTSVWVYRSQCNTCLLCFTFLMAMVLLIAAGLGLVFLNDNGKPSRGRSYNGFCNVPLDARPRPVKAEDTPPEPEAQSLLQVGFLPIRWHTEPMTVFTSADEHAAHQTLDSIYEHVEIQDDLEKVSVVNEGGDNVQFIHDFAANASGIVDKSRCFVMSLNPETVLRPDVFVVNILRGAEFDVRRVNGRVRAQLPPLGPDALLPHAFAEACLDRPIYRLESYFGESLKKRSTDEKSSLYTHFAGKSVWEIAIDNIGEVEKYETLS